MTKYTISSTEIFKSVNFEINIKQGSVLVVST